MAQMETDPPDITNSCEERNRLSLEIEALDIVINLCTELVNFPDTDVNHEMKAILRASIDDTQRKKDTMDSVEDFVFPKKTARPVSPLPNITNKSSGEFIKLITNDIEEYHALTNFLEKEKDFEFFSLKPKPIKPIKIVIKGLPIFTKTHEIQSDLEEEGFTIENVSQLISKKTKTALQFFQVILPCNANNQKMFDLKTVGYMQVKIEGYLIRGITQCFNCNNFFHTAGNCHLKPRCLKCGKEHPTRQCPIKERQENPFCINCQEYGHSACYTKCPKFPKPTNKKKERKKN
ncbi:nucleic-acid-binding protein from transposon X-element [Trichonephila clavipes]|nr:nucleic-acid-binding protein from transposon X-element [Trichonephila clavipes]